MSAGPIKIAHVTTVPMSLRYLLLHQLQAIRSAGYEPVGVSAPGDDAMALVETGIRHVAVPMSRSFSPLSDLASLYRLYRVMKREGFTVVHTHTPKAGLLGQYAALLARVPLRIHTIHGLYLPSDAGRVGRRLFVLLERVTMAFSHHNFSQNPEDVPVAVREGICRADRIELISNGVDLTDFDPARFTAEHRRSLRKLLGLADDHFVVGIVGRLVRKKGYMEVFEATRLLRDRVPNLRVLCVGWADHQKSDVLSPDTVREMGIGDRVIFLGQRTDVPELLSVMDAFALPSHQLEGIPRAAIEAAAMGLPAVVTDIKGCRETVEHGRTGYLVPVRDAKALADALLRLVESPQQRLAFGAAARAKALAEFDERVVFRKILARYAALLSGPSPAYDPAPAGSGNSSAL